MTSEHDFLETTSVEYHKSKENCRFIIADMLSCDNKIELLKPRKELLKKNLIKELSKK